MKQGITRTEHKLKAKHNASNCIDCGSSKLIAISYKLRFANGEAVERWFVKCKKCRRSSEAFQSLNDAIEAWNNGNGEPGDLGMGDDI